MNSFSMFGIKQMVNLRNSFKGMLNYVYILLYRKRNQIKLLIGTEIQTETQTRTEPNRYIPSYAHSSKIF